jgi:hypothetical protein
MAATMTKRAFSGAAQKAAAPARSRAVRVCCAKQGAFGHPAASPIGVPFPALAQATLAQQQSGRSRTAPLDVTYECTSSCLLHTGDNVLQKVQTVAATVAAAALLHVSPVSAGVVLEQPQLKKVRIGTRQPGLESRAVCSSAPAPPRSWMIWFSVHSRGAAIGPGAAASSWLRLLFIRCPRTPGQWAGSPTGQGCRAGLGVAPWMLHCKQQAILLKSYWGPWLEGRADLSVAHQGALQLTGRSCS